MFLIYKRLPGNHETKYQKFFVESCSNSIWFPIRVRCCCCIALEIKLSYDCVSDSTTRCEMSYIINLPHQLE